MRVRTVSIRAFCSSRFAVRDCLPLPAVPDIPFENPFSVIYTTIEGLMSSAAVGVEGHRPGGNAVHLSQPSGRWSRISGQVGMDVMPVRGL
jgi:hypothetical protein